MADQLQTLCPYSYFPHALVDLYHPLSSLPNLTYASEKLTVSPQIPVGDYYIQLRWVSTYWQSIVLSYDIHLEVFNSTECRVEVGRQPGRVEYLVRDPNRVE